MQPKYHKIIQNTSHQSSTSLFGTCFPRRYCLCLLSFIGLFNVYTMRINLSVAIEPMACQFHWNSFQEGVVLSAFFGGYLFGNIPGGWLANKYGGKMIFGIGVLATAILTMILPLCTSGSFLNDSSLNCYCANDDSWCFQNGHYTNNDNICMTIKNKYKTCNKHSYLYILIILRVIMGLFESVTFPALMAVFNHWTPKNERSRMIGTSFAGMAMGTTLGFPLSSFIVASDNKFYGGWVNVFYLFGIIGILWWILWCILVYDSPFNDPFISEQELNYLKKELPFKNQNEETQKVEWKYFFIERSAIAIYIAHFSFDWGFYMLLTELPTYLNDELNLNFAKAGFISVVPYLGQFVVSIVGAVVVDKIIIHEILSRTNARKLAHIVATIPPGILLVICGYLNNATYVVILLSIAAALMGLGNSSYNANCTDISPTLSSIVYSIQNTCGTIPGIISPILTGAILNGDNKKQEWKLIFYISFLVFVIGTAIYCKFGTAKVVPTLNKKQQDDESDFSSSIMSPPLNTNNPHISWSHTDKWKDDDVVGDLNISKLAKKYKVGSGARPFSNSLGILDVDFMADIFEKQNSDNTNLSND